MEFDPKSHVTASELRLAGIPVPDNIPDCAWVPRGSWVYLNQETGVADNRVTWKADVKFTVPFRWLEATFAVRSSDG